MDNLTLIIVLMILTCLSTVLMYLLKLLNVSVMGSRLWAWGAVCGTLGLACLLLRSAWYDAAILKMVGNGFLVGAYACWWSGIRLSMGRKPLVGPCVYVTTAMVACSWLFDVPFPSMTMRLVTFSLAAIYFSVHTIIDLVRGTAGTKRVMRLTLGGLFGLNILVYSVRIVISLIHDNPESFFQLGPVHQAVFLWMIIFLFVLYTGVALLVSELLEDQIQTLRGIVPICASCKKIRDDAGYWQHLELFIEAHSEAEFSHGICPDCMQKLYPELSVSRKKQD